MCVFTVFSLTNSFSAISRLLSPAAIASRISSSRGVMPSWLSRASFTLEGPVRRYGDLLQDHPGFGQLEPEPDAERDEDERNDAAVDLERVLEDQEAVLDELERRDQDAAKDAVKEDGLLHA